MKRKGKNDEEHNENYYMNIHLFFIMVSFLTYVFVIIICPKFF